MATKTVTETVCDLDGTVPATETITFSVGGKSYIIDLCDAYARDMQATLAPYVEAARPTGKAGKAKPAARSYDPAAVRRWAAAQGTEVSARGRVSAELVAAYQAAGN